MSKKSKLGYLNVGVETYGGGHWQTWLDRDLGLAGRVVVGSPSTDSFSSYLVNIDSPILRIPTLAVHLKRDQGEKLEYNLETQMVPVLALDGVAEDLNAPISKASQGVKDALDTTGDHHPLLLSLLADSLSSSLSTPSSTTHTVSPSDIHDLELCLYDVQPPVIGGAKKEFVFSARLDNLFSSWAAVEGICQSVDGGKTESERSAKEPEKVDGEGVRLIALWSAPLSGRLEDLVAEYSLASRDNEEIGSVSYQGAESNFLAAMLHRIPAAFSSGCGQKENVGVEGNQSAELASGGDGSLLERTLASSFLLSCDMGCAPFPNPRALSRGRALSEMARTGMPFTRRFPKSTRRTTAPCSTADRRSRRTRSSATPLPRRRRSCSGESPAWPVCRCRTTRSGTTWPAVRRPASYVSRKRGADAGQGTGSTIGPLVSQIGLRTVDIGCPQRLSLALKDTGAALTPRRAVSMHSIREQGGTLDLAYLVKLFETFFRKYQEVDRSLATDE